MKNPLTESFTKTKTKGQPNQKRRNTRNSNKADTLVIPKHVQIEVNPPQGVVQPARNQVQQVEQQQSQQQQIAEQQEAAQQLVEQQQQQAHIAQQQQLARDAQQQ